MISDIFFIIVLICLMVIIPPLQIINLIITFIQYLFVHKKYKNIQELFTENSRYIDNLFKNKC